MLDIARPRTARKPTQPRLPRYVNTFIDRHGQPRCYFRHNGMRVALRGEIGSPAWWREYSEALAGRAVATMRLPATPRVRAGSVASVIAAFFASAEYQNLRAISRR